MLVCVRSVGTARGACVLLSCQQRAKMRAGRGGAAEAEKENSIGFKSTPLHQHVQRALRHSMLLWLPDMLRVPQHCVSEARLFSTTANVRVRLCLGGNEEHWRRRVQPDHVAHRCARYQDLPRRSAQLSLLQNSHVSRRDDRRVLYSR